MTNIQVIKNFLEGTFASSGSLNSCNGKLFSYQTCIAQMLSTSIIINTTYYSNTSSKHRSMLLRIMEDRHHIIEVNGVPKGEKDLTKYVKDEKV